MPTNNTSQTSQSFIQRQGWSILVAALMLLAIGVLVLLMALNNQQPQTNNTNSSSSITNSINTTQTSQLVSWGFDGEKWTSVGNVPNCSDPLTFPAPFDVSLATSILYPGQTRGGDYKPHGGARFDNSANTDIQIALPIDAKLWRGSRYIQDGEVQYLLDFIAPCGVMMRFDHLKTLSTEFGQIVETQLPQPQPNDSRTYRFSSDKIYLANTTIATSVGLDGNTFVDFGVYDLRKPNTISQQNAGWATTHQNEKETAFFAVCWLEMLPQNQLEIVKSLPGSGTEGKTSDYCK